ncbi:MAG: hypothetical protein ACKVQK_23205 [Burkholderiales bacterium]
MSHGSGDVNLAEHGDKPFVVTGALLGLKTRADARKMERNPQYQSR